MQPNIIFKDISCFMLSSTKRELLTAHKNNMMKTFLAFKLSDVVFILLVNVKMTPKVDILTFVKSCSVELSMKQEISLNQISGGY